MLVHQSDGTGLIARLIGKSDRIESIAYTPDGKILVVSGGIPIHINWLNLLKIQMTLFMEFLFHPMVSSLRMEELITLLAYFKLAI